MAGLGGSWQAMVDLPKWQVKLDSEDYLVRLVALGKEEWYDMVGWSGMVWQNMVWYGLLWYDGRMVCVVGGQLLTGGGTCKPRFPIARKFSCLPLLLLPLQVAAPGVLMVGLCPKMTQIASTRLVHSVSRAGSRVHGVR